MWGFENFKNLQLWFHASRPRNRISDLMYVRSWSLDTPEWDFLIFSCCSLFSMYRTLPPFHRNHCCLSLASIPNFLMSNGRNCWKDLTPIHTHLRRKRNSWQTKLEPLSNEFTSGSPMKGEGESCHPTELWILMSLNFHVFHDWFLGNSSSVKQKKWKN